MLEGMRRAPLLPPQGDCERKEGARKQKVLLCTTKVRMTLKAEETTYTIFCSRLLKITIPMWVLNQSGKLPNQFVIAGNRKKRGAQVWHV
jgi:hypothetical protein